MVLIKNILPSIIFIMFGIILELCVPRKINGYLGYRTLFAMKNEETWKEGNKFSGIMMIVGGFVCLLISLTITLLGVSNHKISTKVIEVATLVIVLCCTSYTEIHLRKIFDKNGHRKSEI